MESQVHVQQTVHHIQTQRLIERFFIILDGHSYKASQHGYKN